jgi:hypothetical protein
MIADSLSGIGSRIGEADCVRPPVGAARDRRPQTGQWSGEKAGPGSTDAGVRMSLADQWQAKAWGRRRPGPKAEAERRPPGAAQRRRLIFNYGLIRQLARPGHPKAPGSERTASCAAVRGGAWRLPWRRMLSAR